ncbi:MAG TPA: FtsX-like permease family protein [Treponemataceae bacterium]|nr:FtsX-like permease family protein [Treponemataceae bacterium]HPS42873.1 FtsX-like permease family protein [Treponemataceae bacterium]
MKTVSLAWRNARRNWPRTALSASAAFASTLIVCLIMSMESGYIDDMIANIKNHRTGDVRVMNRAYLENERVMPLQFFIDDTERALSTLARNDFVAYAVPRTPFVVSIYQKGERIPCRAIGVDFRTDPITSAKNDVLTQGAYPASGSAEILVTAGLAKELSLSVGGKLTILSRTATGGTNGKTFTVSGVVAMSDMDFSGRVFFLDWRTAGDFLRMGPNALAVNAFLKKGTDEESAITAIRNALDASAGTKGDAAFDVRAWHDVSETFAFLKISRVLFAIYGAIFYLLASTVIVNTTMMAVLERRREIGTLAALGMGKRGILALFVAESGIIAAIGIVLGLCAGGLIVGAVHRAGFDIEAIYGTDLGGMGISRVIYPSLAPPQYAYILGMGLMIACLACLVPARIATRVEPADAMRDR